MFSSYEKNEDPQRAITFGDGNQGLVKGLCKIAIVTPLVLLALKLEHNIMCIDISCVCHT
jgi:hypothetical protein